MINPQLHSRIGKVCALVAATLILPGLAFAGSGGQNNQGDNNNNQGNGNVPVVPETNAGWVLVPFFGAVLLYSWRRFSRANA